MSLGSILDVPMKCELCGTVTRLGDCEPDVDGDGSLGCPLPDCGGIAKEDSSITSQEKKSGSQILEGLKPSRKQYKG